MDNQTRLSRDLLLFITGNKGMDKRSEDEPKGDDQPPVASGDQPEVDAPFIRAEVKKALKEFHLRKAPYIGGFTSDICQAAIFRNLGLLLAMANKCLELEYFPWTWKMAAIKAWWTALKTQLLAFNYPVNLYSMVRGYLLDREVIVLYTGEESKRETLKGLYTGWASTIEEDAMGALACVNCWEVRNELRFAPAKTNSMMLTKR
ncbi:hypothetical protein EVAR_74890_1 [Eumeta japonica]|uniref:Uncharacterized protein n=1 Tax=Eumeta variegata TaxID=151549 RepID=A0A4C1YZX3_EUMVA|nr:hypothetical protein EVAR_74890_1 [Eumeta japonica]